MSISAGFFVGLTSVDIQKINMYEASMTRDGNWRVR